MLINENNIPFVNDEKEIVRDIFRANLDSYHGNQKKTKKTHF